tara:strand:+ start:1100 stop:1372 length:273 start_codon:yes stop_codon:yes gene_type:complete
MTKTNINRLQKFIEECDIISEKDGSVTFVLHDLFTLKKDGRPKNKLKLFEFLEKVAEKNKGHFFEDDECFFLRIPKQLKAKLDLTTCEEF